MSDFKIDLGITATDRITKFTGIVISRIQYVTGSNRYQVQPVEAAVDRTNKMFASEWFDEDRLLEEGK